VAQHGCAHGVDIIETRTLIAYGLILLLIVAAIVAIALLRHNSHDRKIARQRARQQVRQDERNDAAPGPD
jgi:heme exporter protein D